MIEFSDILLGRIRIPEWMGAFLRLPEFVRLRGVRLSNVDSFEFKDFARTTRWEHSIAVAYLAHRCASARGLDVRETVHLALGGLLHDVATPPFGHTMEYVLPGFDHELESQRLLHAIPGTDFLPDVPVFASQLPRFRAACKALASELGVHIDPDQVADAVVGRGELGFLIRGTLDLDNADNVTRACQYLGIEVDATLPLQLADWLARQDAMPTDIAGCSAGVVQTWRRYRRELYSAFFNASDTELARQAFLQHVFRRAIAARFPRARLVWNTDERVLFEIETFQDDGRPRAIPLNELVQRYSLLEEPIRIAHVPIENVATMHCLQHPEAATWIEEWLSSERSEFCVLVSSRRYAEVSGELFPPAVGSLIIFKFGGVLKREHIPEEAREHIRDGLSGAKLYTALSNLIGKSIPGWCARKPWLQLSPRRESRIVDSLNHIGDWGFRLSQNDNVHPYPGTFVYAIPASLITALGLKGELVVDPFGGTGQTAVEAVKYGGQAVSADINSIACLAARAKTTFLASDVRAGLRMLTEEDLRGYQPCKPPEIENIESWFHADTLDELCRLRRAIACQRNGAKKQFMEACLSAILPSCTARRGKQHGWFADNTPLPRGVKTPPYHNAMSEFLSRIQRNLSAVEELYAYLERDGRDPSQELSRVRVVQADAATATAADYGVTEGSVAGVITSPPYLCMADYTLGQRLSYYWLRPEALDADFAKEIGARRLRSRKGNALTAYLESMAAFAERMSRLLKPGGFLCTVLGAPTAKAFEEAEVVEAYDRLLAEAGFDLLWERERNIHWHRNYGYAKLKKERISVHVLRAGV